jgi:hypothetical protein
MENNMSNKEQTVWRYLLQHRDADYAEVAEACGVDLAFVKQLVARIGSDNWREEVTPTPTLKPTPDFRWAAYDDGLRIWMKGELVGVIPKRELPHLIADVANKLRYE